MRSSKKSPFKSVKSNPFFPVAVVAVILVGVSLVWWYSRQHQGREARQENQVPASSPAVSAAPGQAINPGTGTTPTPSPAASVATRPAASDTLAAPTGQLYSNNKVQLSLDDRQESTCQTVAGATCTIFVTPPGGQTASFNAPSVDGNGGHYVDWHVKTYGSATGNWKIYAQAKLNGQTGTSPTYTFEVTP